MPDLSSVLCTDVGLYPNLYPTCASRIARRGPQYHVNFKPRGHMLLTLCCSRDQDEEQRRLPLLTSVMRGPEVNYCHLSTQQRLTFSGRLPSTSCTCRRSMKGSRIWCSRWMTMTRFSWSQSAPPEQHQSW